MTFSTKLYPCPRATIQGDDCLSEYYVLLDLLPLCTQLLQSVCSTFKHMQVLRFQAVFWVVGISSQYNIPRKIKC